MLNALSPGTRSRRFHVEFHRRGRFDATITPSTTIAGSAWCARALGLRRRSLYDRLRALAEYDYTRRPEATLILTPSVWEQRLTSRFRVDLSLDDCYGAVESRDALERRDVRLWCQTSFVFGSSCHKLDFGSYLHHRPRVSARLSQRSLLALTSSRRAATRASCRHRR